VERLEQGDSVFAQRIQDIDQELERLRQSRPTVFGHFIRALVMVVLLLMAWYRVVYDGYADVLLYAVIGGVAVWCAATAKDVLEDWRRQSRLKRELSSLLAKPVGPVHRRSMAP
jgi:hypothetical protein